MKPILKRRIDDSVYSLLLENIQNGTWVAGEKLPSESELCETLNVSRVSIRSALQRLQTLGFIQVKRAKGSFVTRVDDFDFDAFDEHIELTPKQMEDIAVLREAVEESAIRLILANDEADLSRIREAYEGMRRGAEAVDIDAFTRYDVQFHFALLVASGNANYARIIQIFRDDFFRYLREMNKFMLRDRTDNDKLAANFAHSLAYHAELLRALENKDGKALEIQRRQLGRARESRAFYFRKVSGRLPKRKDLEV